jgi:hypothetical protein
MLPPDDNETLRIMTADPTSFARALANQFGARALAVAERQHANSSGAERRVWAAIVSELKRVS